MGSSSARVTNRIKRLTVIVVMLAAMGMTASCGFDVQTLQPYTPAQGVNVDVGPAGQVQVRNLLIISAEEGRGVLSATLTSDVPDELVAVSGVADALDGDGAPLSVTMPAPVPVNPYEVVLLTDLPPIVVTGPALKPGLTARLTLRFRDAGEVTVHAPVMSTDFEWYDKVTDLEPLTSAS